MPSPDRPTGGCSLQLPPAVWGLVPCKPPAGVNLARRHLLRSSSSSPAARDLRSCGAVRWRCGHPAEAACAKVDSIAAARPGRRGAPADGATNGELSALLVVEAGVEYCGEDAVEGVEACAAAVRFKLPCGHEKLDAPCHLAFRWAAAPEEAPRCERQVDIASPLCGHPLTVRARPPRTPHCTSTTRRVRCWVASLLEGWAPWGGAPGEVNPWEDVVVGLDQHGEPRHVKVVSEGAARPAPPPAGVPAAAIGCGRACLLKRACGHECETVCHEAYAELDGGELRGRRLRPIGECAAPVRSECGDCRHVTVRVCHVAAALTKAGRAPQCVNLVEKPCAVCNVNLAKVTRAA
eukprot:1184431-Prorocentrum_minimum.AAC.1